MHQIYGSIAGLHSLLICTSWPHFKRLRQCGYAAGSGKSSLLGAMLGLMQQVSGTPDTLRGKVAYVPQVGI